MTEFSKEFAKELAVEAKTENLDVVLDFVSGELKNFDMKTQTKIAVVVEEIFVNIARYAYAPETGDAIIRVAVNNELEAEVAIEFEDGGKPYNPLEKADPDITASAEEREPGGLGIFMVKKIMDKTEYRRENNKNILTVRKSIKRVKVT